MNNQPTPLMSEFDITVQTLSLVHKYVYPPNSTYTGYESGRASCGFVCVIDGKAQFDFKDKIYTIEKNDIVFLPSNSKYSVTNNGDVPFLHYTANFELLPEKEKNGSFYEYFIGNQPLILKTKNHPYFESQFIKLLTTWDSKKSGYKLESKARLYSLASEFFKEFSSLNVSETDFERILPVKRYIDENYTKEISLATLAVVGDMPESTMRKLFTSVFDISPIEYKNELRLMKAKDLLLSGIYSVSEVSEMCGFDDANYFSRIFKKYMGISPLKYKSAH